jgi:uncharacterized coiled-coil protein SlyX
MNLLRQSNYKTILPVLLVLTLGCVALLPPARAACQKGCLTGDNTVLGEDALLSNVNGFENTAVGFNALLSNTAGVQNTAIGSSALVNTTEGFGNTGTGLNSLHDNTVGGANTANGANALYHNNGSNNTAIGFIALLANTSGEFNTANGASALGMNTSGEFNTATGYNALLLNRTGNNNVAVGASAGQNLTTGSDNIYIGSPGGNNDESRKIRIGIAGRQNSTSIAGISGGTVPDGVGVIVGTNGKLGTVISSARFKDEIKPMDKASEAILALRPVTFRYKHELDPAGIPQFGLVAEDVEKVNPALVARDDQGKVHTVRYEAVNAMLLNEFLKEHKKVEEQQATIAELKSTVAQQQKGFQAGLAKQQKQIEALTANLQKVSDQFELSKSAPQTVVTNQ